MLIGLLRFIFIFAYIKTKNSYPQPLTAKEEAECFERYKNGDNSAGNVLIEKNMRLVAYISKKYQNISNEFEDLISVGTIGLIKAVKTFKPSKGTRLATYASRCIDNEILMHLRSMKKHAGGVSFQDAMGTDQEGNEITLGDKLADESVDIEGQAATRQQVSELNEKLKLLLTDRERGIIEKRYGLTGGPEITQREIAREMDISRSYV